MAAEPIYGPYFCAFRECSTGGDSYELFNVCSLQGQHVSALQLAGSESVQDLICFSQHQHLVFCLAFATVTCHGESSVFHPQLKLSRGCTSYRQGTQEVPCELWLAFQCASILTVLKAKPYGFLLKNL